MPCQEIESVGIQIAIGIADERVGSVVVYPNRKIGAVDLVIVIEIAGQGRDDCNGATRLNNLVAFGSGENKAVADGDRDLPRQVGQHRPRVGSDHRARTSTLPTESRALAVAFAGEDHFLVTLEQGGHVWMFDTASGKLMWRKKIPPLQEVHRPGLAVSPDGNVIATSSTERVHVWNVRSGHEVAILQHSRLQHEGGPAPLAFSPNGLQLVAVRESIHAWNSRTWKLFSSVKLPAACQSFAFNHDSSQLAVVVEGRKVNLYDTEAWLPLETLEVDSPVHDVVFNHDGTRLTLACDENTVRFGHCYSARICRTPRPSRLGLGCRF